MCSVKSSSKKLLKSLFYFVDIKDHCSMKSYLNIKDWSTIIHLILNNDSHCLKRNSMALHSMSKFILQNLKVVESAIQGFMMATSP